MKFLAPILLLIFTSCVLHKRDAAALYKNLDKASANLQKGKLIKAQHYITQSKKCSLGMCAVWSPDPFFLRDSLSTEILLKSKKYDEALLLADTMSVIGNTMFYKRDVLRMKILLEKYGKETIRIDLLELLETTIEPTGTDLMNGYFYSMHFNSINYDFKFYSEWTKEPILLSALIANVPFYQLLKESH